jgi:hypothetical protein
VIAPEKGPECRYCGKGKYEHTLYEDVEGYGHWVCGEFEEKTPTEAEPIVVRPMPQIWRNNYFPPGT